MSPVVRVMPVHSESVGKAVNSPPGKAKITIAGLFHAQSKARTMRITWNPISIGTWKADVTRIGSDVPKVTFVGEIFPDEAAQGIDPEEWNEKVWKIVGHDGRMTLTCTHTDGSVLRIESGCYGGVAVLDEVRDPGGLCAAFVYDEDECP